VPHRARATHFQDVGLRALPDRQRALRRRGEGRSPLGRSDRARAGLHIPWPNPEAFAICPWRDELLDGMLGSSILGFHTQFHCNNFLDTVDRVLEARVDRET
jgi:hypothetical protein